MHRSFIVPRWLVLAYCLSRLSAIAADAPWAPIPVPGAWERSGIANASTHDGYAWYRTWLKPHDSFFTPHERNLFAESVTLSIRSLANAHEVFINGTRIGGGGSFPPHFQDAQTGNHRHKVPPGLLKKGLWNQIAIRVYNASGDGGFLREAPFIMDYFNECVLEGPWEFRLGDEASGLGSALNERPATSAFDQYHEANRVLGEAETFVHGRKLPPAETMALMRPARDLAVDLLLSEPLVAQPTHLSFDERGRLWVSQYRQYPYPAGLKMLSRDKYYRAHYDAVPQPPPNHTRGRDVISVHEDTDGDGVFDKHTVFQDGLNLANAAVRGRGGVWVMNTPYLLYYPDANNDDIPDSPPVVHLAGFGMEDTHSVANGLVWGLDGWLYGGQGSTTSSHVVRPDIDPPGAEGVYFEGCMVWRYHPKTHAYEVFAEGSGNTFGLEVDAEGRLFSGHNGGETRGWHYLQGGYYLKQGFDPGKFGPQRNPYTYGDLGVIKPRQPIQRFSHLFAMGDGTALPSSRRGQLFAIDPLHNLVLASERSWRGATFETQDVDRALFCEDDGFRPVFIVNAPDGSIYVADFYEHYIAHGQHYQSQIDPTTGRVYRLRGKDAHLERDLNLAAKTSTELTGLLGHPNKWHRHTAIRLLGERRDPAVVDRLKRLTMEGSTWSALGALCALHQAEELDETTLAASIQHAEPIVRTWAARIAGDRWGAHPGLGSPRLKDSPAPKLPSSIQRALLDQAPRESNAEARSQFAASARRFDPTTALDLAARLAGRSEDLTDAFLPSLCWWIFEHHMNSAPDTVLGFFDVRSNWDLPLIGSYTAERVMRKLIAEGRRQDLVAAARLLRAAPGAAHREPLLRGLQESLRGRPAAALPAELESALADTGGAPLMVRLRQNDAAALKQAIELLRDPKSPLAERLLYARVLGELRPAEAVAPLLALAQSEAQAELRRTALAALGAFDDASIAPAILPSLKTASTEIRGAALTLLLSRTHSITALLEALEKGVVAPSSLPAEAVDRLRKITDQGLRSRAEKLFPKTGEDTDFAARRLKVETALRSGAGNPYEGEPLYQQRCAGCHKLFYKGGSVGPDLTNYQRDNLGTMLVSILNPNAEIREGYAGYEVETKDGRCLTGFVKDRDARAVILRGLDSQDTVLQQGEIVKLEPLGRSLMPEGLLDDLTDQQLRDFLAYLRSSQPFTR